jgi:hypothetical protein
MLQSTNSQIQLQNTSYKLWDKHPLCNPSIHEKKIQKEMNPQEKKSILIDTSTVLCKRLHVEEA